MASSQEKIIRKEPLERDFQTQKMKIPHLPCKMVVPCQYFEQENQTA